MNGLGKRKASSKGKKKKALEQSPKSDGDNNNTNNPGEESAQNKSKKKEVKEVKVDPVLKAKIEEEQKKHIELQNKIKELEQKLNFEKSQREKIITFKKQEIEQKDEAIKKMKDTNEQLKKELITIEVKVQENLDILEWD